MSMNQTDMFVLYFFQKEYECLYVYFYPNICKRANKHKPDFQRHNVFMGEGGTHFVFF